jgi:hypothetical protein
MRHSETIHNEQRLCPFIRVWVRELLLDIVYQGLGMSIPQGDI